MSVGEAMQKRAEEFVARYKAVREQLGRVIVGHDDIVHGVLTCLFVGGHCLLEGVPGLGKTLLVKTLAETLNLDFSRIQFTPDLMPADILGTNMVVETPEGRRAFEFQKGPVFTQICLADEINRATPKTQSALLEAMQEHKVSIAGNIFHLEPPFFVMATQNPLEQEGTYPLPEAQLDRFLLQVNVGYPDLAAERRMMLTTTGVEEEKAVKVLSAEELTQAQRVIRQIPVGESVVEAILKLSRSGRPETSDILEVKQHVAWAPGPRASQALMLACRAR